MAANREQKVNTKATMNENPYGRMDEELALVAQREERRKKLMKCCAYIAAFVVFQTTIILIFVLTITKVKTPNFRVGSTTFENFQYSTSSFHIRMNVELSVKNKNFGCYKYQNSTIEFFYQDIKVGKAVIPKGRANFRSTKKFTIPVDLSSINVPGEVLGNEFRQHAWILLTSKSTLKGKVELMLVFKKNKSSNMNLNPSSKQLQDLKCR